MCPCDRKGITTANLLWEQQQQQHQKLAAESLTTSEIFQFKHISCFVWKLQSGSYNEQQSAFTFLNLHVAYLDWLNVIIIYM